MMPKRESEGRAVELQSAEGARGRPRKRYSRPRLEAFGALMDITLAGTSVLSEKFLLLTLIDGSLSSFDLV